MTRRVLEKLCTKKVCVDFLAPILRILEVTSVKRPFRNDPFLRFLRMRRERANRALVTVL